MSVLGGERQNWMSPIFAFATRVGPPATLTAFCVKTRPSISSVSSIVPPSFLTIATSRRSTFVEVSGSMMRSIASTAIGASTAALAETTFELSEVEATLMSSARSVKSIGRLIASMYASAFFSAVRKASEMIVGWMPFSSRRCAASRMAPQSTVTDVVPSPASVSCDLATSTSILAAGCATSMRARIVAPSFVMITSPDLDTTILSMPFGPSDVRTTSATALAAVMLFSRTLRSCARVRSMSPRVEAFGIMPVEAGARAGGACGGS
mmetsp:Transcript_7546/g.23867  ORF Transcript_7546/g.23867 Transcript_7546/m.23867 type:complete len:266 (+) Transcript_7546:1040-1837(+)